MTPSEEVILEQLEPGMMLLKLNRPERLNALSWPMIDALHAALGSIGEMRDLRALIVTGTGRGFCSGLDISSEESIGTDDELIEIFRRQERVAGLALALRSLPQPVIAAVNGPAAGGGMAIALASDARIFAESGRMNVAFVRIGLSGCDVGVSHLLPRIVGLGIASELMLTGRHVDAHEARAIGLANRVVPDGEELDAAVEMARQIARNSPFGVWMTKQVLRRNSDSQSLESAIELENRTQVLAVGTSDLTEALAAFRERRAPNFHFR